MVKRTKKLIRIDLNQFKIHLYLKSDVELTFHFDSPSRRFYLSVIVFVIQEMKKQGKITSIPLQKYIDVLALLNETVGGTAGSSKMEYLLPRIYRKWKDALPDLENAPLFKVVGRNKRYDDSMEKVYSFSEIEKDRWANLFEYKGSHENVRLRFSIDQLGSNLDDVIIVCGEYPKRENAEAWEKFITHLNNEEDKFKPEHFDQEPEEPNALQVQLKHGPQSIPNKRRLITLCALALFIIGATAIAVWKTNLFAPQFEIASVEKMAFPLPDRPSIAVLPFENMGGEPEQEFFSDGMTEDLITDLSKISGLFVIGRKSVFNYKGKPIKIRQIAEELGVRYVFEGSVRKFDNTVRINAQLIDPITGENLWAERYDARIIDIFSLQDKITQNIVETLAVKLTIEELQTIPKRETDNLDAYLTFLKGWQLYRRFTATEISKAIPLFEKAIILDPNFSKAYASIARVYLELSVRATWRQELGIKQDMVIDRLYRNLNKAMKTPNSLALAVSAELKAINQIFEEAISDAKKAISLDPNDPESHQAMGIALMLSGMHSEAVESFKIAMRLDPIQEAAKGYLLGMAYFHLSQFNKTVSLCENSLKYNPENPMPLWYLPAAQAHLGNKEEAALALTKLMNDPYAKLIYSPYRFNFKHSDDKKLLEDGLRKAGMK